MKRQIFKISLIIVAIVTVLSGCATNGGSQQGAQQNASQNSGTSTTVSGYLDVGTGKKF